APGGEVLLPHARTVLASLEDAHVAVAGVDRDIRTRVEVIANESISIYLLPAALGEGRKEWPNLRLSVTVGMCPSIAEGLSTGRYDVGFMLQTMRCGATNGRPGNGLSGTAIALSEVSLALFAVPGHPQVSCTDRPPIRRMDFAGETVFISDARGYFFDLVRDYFQTDGVPGPRLEATGSVEAVKRSVISNQFAFGLLPRYAIADDLGTGRFALARIHPALPRVRLEAIASRTRQPAPPAVATLLDAVRRQASHVATSSMREPRMAGRGSNTQPAVTT